MFVVQQLARVETIMHGEVPKRKAIYQAREHNPNFFDAVFTDLINKDKDKEMVRRALETIDRYLEDRDLHPFSAAFRFLGERRRYAHCY